MTPFRALLVLVFLLFAACESGEAATETNVTPSPCNTDMDCPADRHCVPFVDDAGATGGVSDAGGQGASDGGQASLGACHPR